MICQQTYRQAAPHSAEAEPGDVCIQKPETKAQFQGCYPGTFPWCPLQHSSAHQPGGDALRFGLHSCDIAPLISVSFSATCPNKPCLR